jgi:hypothetical protein
MELVERDETGCFALIRITESGRMFDGERSEPVTPSVSDGASRKR